MKLRCGLAQCAAIGLLSCGGESSDDSAAVCDPNGPFVCRSDIGVAGASGSMPDTSERDAGAVNSADENTDAGFNADEIIVYPPLRPVEAVDLLFMIDNSGSMSDKQEILRLSLPRLLQRLIDPLCLDSEGVQGPTADPGTGQCPQGFTRQFTPIEDINVAVITSSLGDAGANSTCEQGGDNELADMSHTIGSLPRGAVVASNSPDLGFLEWRAGSILELDNFSSNFDRMVGSVGENGCGWESSLESWYRFLIDPFPYQQLERVPCNEGDTQNLCVQRAIGSDGRIELDTKLLEQRAAFLRPDSLVAIIMLTDENDCSMQIGNQTWVVASNNGQMYRGTSICESNPNDQCCHICAVNPPNGCAVDPICDENATSGAAVNRLSSSEDALNLRCYQHKRRFGLDFLYPTQRYINALSQTRLCWSDTDLSLEDCPESSIVGNPLYPPGGRTDSSRVFLGGIIGVPYQSISSSVDALGNPLQDSTTPLRFKTWDELSANNNEDWDKILGNVGTPYQPAANGKPALLGTAPVAPTNPYMLESEFERPGVVAGNAVNGRDWDTSSAVAGGGTPPREDLQYSCIFPLLQPRDCSDANTENCDCKPGSEDKPLCEEIPGISAVGNTQYWAKAYPGTRQLEVLRGYGPNSILTSICAKNIEDTTRADFGYRPVVSAIVERLQTQLPSQ